ncbi:MAG: hypothetical protein ABIF08_04650 [Nanoarchaeota archaeon]
MRPLKEDIHVLGDKLEFKTPLSAEQSEDYIGKKFPDSDEGKIEFVSEVNRKIASAFDIPWACGEATIGPYMRRINRIKNTFSYDDMIKVIISQGITDELERASIIVDRLTSEYDEKIENGKEREDLGFYLSDGLVWKRYLFFRPIETEDGTAYKGCVRLFCQGVTDTEWRY